VLDAAAQYRLRSLDNPKFSKTKPWMLKMKKTLLLVLFKIKTFPAVLAKNNKGILILNL
jgi:hypothetical protein